MNKLNKPQRVSQFITDAIREKIVILLYIYIYIYIGVIPRNLSSPLLVIYSSFGFKTDFIMWRISREKHIKAAVPFSALRRPDVYINTAELPEESSVCQSSSPWLKSEHTAVTLRSRASV